MKFIKWLKPMDTAGIKCNIWIGDDCVYAGDMYDIPYWLGDYEIDDEDINGEPIAWCHQIRSTVDNEGGTEGLNGFVICLKEKDIYVGKN